MPAHGTSPSCLIADKYEEPKKIVVVKKEEEEKHDKKWGKKLLTKKCEWCLSPSRCALPLCDRNSCTYCWWRPQPCIDIVAAWRLRLNNCISLIL
jgi:hypothetical protein